jgi:hypothetical protein
MMLIGVLTSAALAFAQELPIDVYPERRKPEGRLAPSRPPDTPTRPPGSSVYPRDVGVGHDPAFIEPLAGSYRTNAGSGRYGMSGWTAPNVPVGGAQGDAGEVSGWLSLGFTFTWGGPH